MLLSKCLRFVFFPFVSACRFPFTALRLHITMLLLLGKQRGKHTPNNNRMSHCADSPLCGKCYFSLFPSALPPASLLSTYHLSLCLSRFWLLTADCWLLAAGWQCLSHLVLQFFQRLAFRHRDYATIFIFILLPFAFLVCLLLSVKHPKRKCRLEKS